MVGEDMKLYIPYPDAVIVTFVIIGEPRALYMPFPPEAVMVTSVIGEIFPTPLITPQLLLHVGWSWVELGGF